jgi:hypothetical protein
MTKSSSHARFFPRFVKNAACQVGSFSVETAEFELTPVEAAELKLVMVKTAESELT